MICETVIEARGWEAALPDLPGLADRLARAAIEAEGRDPAAWTLCLLACDDARIAALNAGFRGRAAPTNVLSWPACAPLPAQDPDAPRHLGDIALALGTTRAEARTRSIPLKDHAAHLILHGCLHLLGHEHGTAAAATVMEGIESRVLTRLGFADPWLREDAPVAHPDG